MKKQVKVLLILILIASKSISQNSKLKDSVTCIPNEQLRRAVALIEKSKVMETELNLYRLKDSNFQNLIFIKDSTIAMHILNENRIQELADNRRKMIENMNHQVRNLNYAMDEQDKLLRRQKLKKWLVGLLGLGLGIFIAQ